MSTVLGLRGIFFTFSSASLERQVGSKSCGVLPAYSQAESSLKITFHVYRLLSSDAMLLMFRGCDDDSHVPDLRSCTKV